MARTDLAYAHRWWLTALGAASTGFATALFSSDWCCTPVGMGLAGAVIAKVEQRLMSMSWAHPYRGRLGLRAAYIALLGLTIGLLFLLDRPGIFEMAFGIRPPSGLRDLHIKRHYAGGPGDDAILISFVADKATMEKLLAAGSFKPNSDLTEFYPAHKTWQELWGRAIGGFAATFGGKEWESVPAMQSPKAYTSGKLSDRHTTVLWDEADGRAYALSTQG